MAARIRVLLIDDHVVVREGLAALTTLAPELVAVGQAGSVREALAMLETCVPDLVVTDFYLPDGTALDLLLELNRSRRPVPTLVLSISGSDENVFRALQSGASGYILKSASADELLRAMRAVASGQPWISGDLRSAAERAASKPSLSEKERQVIALLAEGCSNEQVAERIHVSVATVKTHVSHCMQKLGANNRTDAVARARQSGILPP